MSDNEKFLILGYCVGKYLEEKGLNLNETLDVILFPCMRQPRSPMN